MCLLRKGVVGYVMDDWQMKVLVFIYILIIALIYCYGFLSFLISAYCYWEDVL